MRGGRCPGLGGTVPEVQSPQFLSGAWQSPSWWCWPRTHPRSLGLRHPHPCKLGPEPRLWGALISPHPPGVTSEDSRSQDIWGTASPRSFLLPLWPQQLYWLRSPHPGRAVPEVPLANPFLGWRSVLHPSQGWATPIPCLPPGLQTPSRPQSRLLPGPLLPPKLGQARWTGVWITCRRLSEACGLSSNAGSVLSRCTTGLLPRGGGHGCPK